MLFTSSCLDTIYYKCFKKYKNTFLCFAGGMLESLYTCKDKNAIYNYISVVCANTITYKNEKIYKLDLHALLTEIIDENIYNEN